MTLEKTSVGSIPQVITPIKQDLKSSSKQGCLVNRYKVTILTLQIATTVVTAVAAIVAGVFASYILLGIAASACLISIASAILTSRIKIAQNGGKTSNVANEIPVDVKLKDPKHEIELQNKLDGALKNIEELTKENEELKNTSTQIKKSEKSNQQTQVDFQEEILLKKQIADFSEEIEKLKKENEELRKVSTQIPHVLKPSDEGQRNLTDNASLKKEVEEPSKEIPKSDGHTEIKSQSSQKDTVDQIQDNLPPLPQVDGPPPPPPPPPKLPPLPAAKKTSEPTKKVTSPQENKDEIGNSTTKKSSNSAGGIDINEILKQRAEMAKKRAEKEAQDKKEDADAVKTSSNEKLIEKFKGSTSNEKVDPLVKKINDNKEAIQKRFQANGWGYSEEIKQIQSFEGSIEEFLKLLEDLKIKMNQNEAKDQASYIEKIIKSTNTIIKLRNKNN